MRRLQWIGLTGGIGSGKSLVLRSLQRRGVPVLQTDLVAHQLLRKRDIFKKLIRAFGHSIVGPAGRIDRKKLALAAFRSPREQQKLNRIVHPAVRREVKGWLRSQKRKVNKPCLAVVEVPLIFERGFNRSFDGVVSISAPTAIRHRRLLRQGWDLAEVRRREKLQWPQARKDRKADWVIFNKRTERDLVYAVDRWLERFG